MNRTQIIEHFTEIGALFQQVADSKTDPKPSVFSDAFLEKFRHTVEREIHYNGWFEVEFIQKSLSGISTWLESVSLSNWSAPYPFHGFQKNLGIIMAGNIPLVGFHDFLCGLVSGYRLQVKMSSEDSRLLTLVLEALCEMNAAYRELIVLNPLKLSGFDAVIGTGSDASLLHFKSYFKEIPHLLRGNRTSIAILTGEETAEELTLLGNDVFDYFGRGCRNVTHLLVPESYSFDSFFKAIQPFQNLFQNKKYGNNYDYYRTIYLMNRGVFLENGFLLLVETETLQPPLAVLNYHTYASEQEVQNYLEKHKEKIQCVVGKDYMPFGSAQTPSLTDYADNINTMMWLGEPKN